MTRATAGPEAASLIEAARCDLRYAESILASEADPLLAVIAVARAAKSVDDATFALLDEVVAGSRRSVENTHQGYGRLRPTPTKETL